MTYLACLLLQGKCVRRAEVHETCCSHSSHTLAVVDLARAHTWQSQPSRVCTEYLTHDLYVYIYDVSGMSALEGKVCEKSRSARNLLQSFVTYTCSGSWTPWSSDSHCVVSLGQWEHELLTVVLLHHTRLPRYNLYHTMCSISFLPFRTQTMPSVTCTMATKLRTVLAADEHPCIHVHITTTSSLVP